MSHTNLEDRMRDLADDWRDTAATSSALIGREIWRDCANELDGALKRHQDSKLGEHGRPCCVMCGAEILSERTAFRKVIGYERHRDQGGTNAVRLRQVTDEWACPSCVDKEAMGVSAHQQALA